VIAALIAAHIAAHPVHVRPRDIPAYSTIIVDDPLRNYGNSHTHVFVGHPNGTAYWIPHGLRYVGGVNMDEVSPREEPQPKDDNSWFKWLSLGVIIGAAAASLMAWICSASSNIASACEMSDEDAALMAMNCATMAANNATMCAATTTMITSHH
jgi:hypothetical protein